MRRFAKLVLVAVTLMATPALAEDTPPATDTPSETTYRQRGALLDRSPQKRSQMLSLFIGLPYGYFFYGFPFGVGGRYLIPILNDGFLSSVNDSFGIEFGADLSGAVGLVPGGRFYPTLGIPVEVYWMFHFTPKFAAYAKVGVVLEINFVPYACVGTTLCRGAVSASPIGNIGINYKFGEKVTFRAEAGYPWIKIGLGFDM